MMKNVRPARRRLRWQKIELELIFYRRPNVYNVLFKNKLRIACVSSTVLPENLGKRPQRSPKEIVRLCDRSSLSLRQSNEFCPKKYFGHCDNRSRFASRLVNGRWLIFFWLIVPIRTDSQIVNHNAPKFSSNRAPFRTQRAALSLYLVHSFSILRLHHALRASLSKVHFLIEKFFR